MTVEVQKITLNQCGECPIRHNAVCAECEQSELLLLESMKTYRSYAPGETIIWAGDELSFLGSVVEGVASLSRTLADGRRQMVGMLFRPTLSAAPVAPAHPMTWLPPPR